MSFLEQQLRELQIKKHKISYFRLVLGLLSATEGSEEETEAQKQAIEELTQFINARVEAIESGKEAAKSESSEAASSQFSEEEVVILKQIVDRALNRQAPQTKAFWDQDANKGAFASDDAPPQAPKKPESPGQKAKRQDKIQFALANRHLDGKRVTVIQNGNQVGGKVVGLDAPNVIVKTDTGHTVPVDLDNLMVE